MDYDEILKKILRRYAVKTDQIRTMQVIESKLAKHTATYADAEHFAQEISRALTGALREYLPEALTDGKLFRAAAEVLLEQPMKTACKDVADIAAQIQKQMNEDSEIEINPIIPEMNQDQIDGIITGICNSESFEAGQEVLYDQVENCMEGYVDDFVRENADFHYRAGLFPTIERRTTGKCCAWCAKLVGSYPYEDVKDRGNDVFRRHKNCHCQVLYNPGNGSKKRQNVHWRQWTEDREPATIEARKSFIGIDLQKFGRTTGDYRRAKWGNDWPEGSLKETVSKFARGSKGLPSRDKKKIEYRSKDGRYLIKYDKKGDYFRIEDLSITESTRQCVDLNGNQIVDISENGKQISVSQDEYERRTHYKNTDKKGR